MKNFEVVGPEGGESYWQPTPANGYVTVIVTPALLPGIPFSMGTQTVPAGAFVREHAHQTQHEVIFTLDGEGTAFLDGAPHPMRPGTFVAIGPGVSHRFVNDGGEELRFLWTISPTGLEDFFRHIGRPKHPGSPAPTPFDRPSTDDGAHGFQALGTESAALPQLQTSRTDEVSGAEIEGVRHHSAETVIEQNP